MSLKRKLKIGILGLGEVGSAIAKFYKNPKIKTRNRKTNDDLAGVEVLHICIPYSSKFFEIVIKEIKLAKPKLTIIHSTIPPHTTKKICRSVGLKFNVVHSPVRGVHPHLYEGIKTFIKYIGADSRRAGIMAKNHLAELGLKTKVFMPSVTTEIAKILDTTYYGVCIAWHGEMKEICDKLGVDFEQAVTDFNKSYNEGYVRLGKTNVVRPVLYPPKGPIGGHCVVPNAKILNKFLKSKAADLVLKYK